MQQVEDEGAEMTDMDDNKPKKKKMKKVKEVETENQDLNKTKLLWTCDVEHCFFEGQPEFKAIPYIPKW